MKVALMFTGTDRPGAIGERIDEEALYLYLPIDSEARLPIGSEIHFEDPDSNEGIDLVVTKWHFFLSENLLCLEIVVDKNSEITHEKFKKYIEANWVGWFDIRNQL